MVITTTLKLSQNIEREEILLNSICKISITLDPKQGTQEKNYYTNSPRNSNTKILNNINKFPSTLKRSITTIKCVYFREPKLAQYTQIRNCSVSQNKG